MAQGKLPSTAPGLDIDPRLYAALNELYMYLAQPPNVRRLLVGEILKAADDTVILDVTGQTVLLPLAAEVEIGHDITIAMGVDGSVAVSTSGQDTIYGY